MPIDVHRKISQVSRCPSTFIVRSLRSQLLSRRAGFPPVARNSLLGGGMLRACLTGDRIEPRPEGESINGNSLRANQVKQSAARRVKADRSAGSCRYRSDVSM